MINEKPRILIVEDNQILAENFERILRSDFSINISHTASDAILKIDKMLPDLILLDVLLSGHSAFALLNELQSYVDTLKTPIIICSDVVGSIGQEALMNYGVVKIIDKSKTSPRELRQTCRKVTGRE